MIITFDMTALELQLLFFKDFSLLLASTTSCYFTTLYMYEYVVNVITFIPLFFTC